MKKIILILIVLVLLPSIALAAKSTSGEKIDTALENEIQERIDGDAGLQGQIDNIQLGTGGGLKLYDADDQFLGIMMGFRNFVQGEHEFQVYNPTFGGIVYWTQNNNGEVYVIDPTFFPTLIYINDNCTGPSYLVNLSPPAIKTLKYNNYAEEYFDFGTKSSVSRDSLYYVDMGHDGNEFTCRPFVSVSPELPQQVDVYEYTIVEPPFNLPVALPLRIEYSN